MTRWRVAGAALSLAAVAAVAVVAFRHVDLRAAVAALRRADPALLTAAALVNLATILAQGQRLHALVRALAPVSRRDAAEAVSLGFAGSQVLPARGGEVVKLTFLSRATSVSSPVLVGLITLENVLNAGGLLLVALAVTFASTVPEWVRKLAVLGALGFPAALALIYRWRPGVVDPARHRVIAALQRLRNQLHEGFTPARRPRVLGTAFAWTVLSWALELATAMLTLAAFHTGEGMVTALVLMLGVNAAILLPVTPGQIGVYEATATLVLKQAGMPASTAVVVALFYHLVHMVPTLALAGGFLVHRQLRRATPV